MSFQQAKRSILKGSLQEAIRDAFVVIRPFLGDPFDPAQKEPVLLIKALAIRIREWTAPPDDLRRPPAGDTGWPSFPELRTPFAEGPIRFLWVAEDTLAAEPDRDQRLERLVEVLRTRTDELFGGALSGCLQQIEQLERFADRNDRSFRAQFAQQYLAEARRHARYALWLARGRNLGPGIIAAVLDAVTRHEIPVAGHTTATIRSAALLAEDLSYVCPECASANVAEIVYGLLRTPLPPPAPGERKTVEGGCMVGDESRKCLTCYHKFVPQLAFDDVFGK